jgi:type II secretory pathway component PulM
MTLFNWWRERNARERLTLSLAMGVIVILAIYLVLEPIMLERKQMLENLPQLRTDLLWMKKNSAQLKTLQKRPGVRMSSVSSSPSLSMIQSLVNSLSLQDSLNELGPGPGQSIRIQFNQITYSDLMNFMYRVKEANAKINSAQISRFGDQLGNVQALIIIGG